MIVPEIILGPPGTGKTTTLIGLLEEELAAGTHPSRIGYLSFTRKAAQEAVERSLQKFSEMRRQDFPYFRTLHSLCFRLMGLTSGSILEGRKLEEFGEAIGYKITGRFSLEDGTIFGFERGDRLLFMENLARVRQVPLSEVYHEDDDDLSFWEVERFARALAAYKAEHDVIDFTDMLRMFVDSPVGLELDVLFIDEAQDLSLLQWEVVRKLAAGVRRLVIAGDDDQAIYRWAGADVATLVDMEGQARVLSQSYRVPRAVQTVATEIVARIQGRRPKVWQPRDAEGAVVRHTSFRSVDLSGPDVLVLGRNRFFLREIERDIRSLGYLYEFQGKRSIAPSTLDAVLTWERLRKDRPNVSYADVRKMYAMLKTRKSVAHGHKLLPGIHEEADQVTYQMLVDKGGLLVPKDRLWYDALDELTHEEIAYIRAALRRGEDLLRPPRIRLSTIHGIKGGQAQEVVLLTDMAARTMREYERDPEDEARVWYVAVTRAIEKLHIVAPRTKNFYRV